MVDEGDDISNDDCDSDDDKFNRAFLWKTDEILFISALDHD